MTRLFKVLFVVGRPGALVRVDLEDLREVPAAARNVVLLRSVLGSVRCSVLCNDGLDTALASTLLRV